MIVDLTRADVIELLDRCRASRIETAKLIAAKGGPGAKTKRLDERLKDLDRLIYKLDKARRGA